jgi:hypothetical protein
MTEPEDEQPSDGGEGLPQPPVVPRLLRYADRRDYQGRTRGGGGHFVHDRSAPPVADSWLTGDDEESPPAPAPEPEEKPRRLFRRRDRSEPPPA